MTTQQITITFNPANSNVLAWIQKIAEQSRHPQYGGDIRISPPSPPR